MGLSHSFTLPEPPREQIDVLPGPVVVEFGTDWCGFCRAAQPAISGGFSNHDAVRHIKVEDGSGRRLGRSFGVKLWPTLVFLRDGIEVTRLVRPSSRAAVEEALARIDPSA